VSNEGTAIVTGSSSGIGKAIAQTLLAEGWSVVGFDIAPSGIEHAAFEAVAVDLSDGDAAEAAAAKVGDARALIHAAGAARYAPLGKLRAADSELIWRVHVDAAVRMANLVIPAMAARGLGRIVLIGSRASQGIAGRSQYGAAKAALVALARSWAAEVVSSGVTVNVVSPAATQTALLDDPARKTDPPRMPPIGRYIRPDEIAATTSFLLSPAAAAITGQEIMICGGASL
jgi:NAD(P)-dependent dehydrogenase (short-subunit alcohol dehydrogenase family)